MELENYLINAEKIFLSEGLDNFSMEWLANKTGITKKTLYNNFDSREELLISIINFSKENAKNDMLPKFSEFGKDSIDIFKDWIAHSLRILNDYRKFLLPSLKNRFPEYYLYFINTMYNYCREILALLIPRGRGEGYILRNFNIEILSSMVFNQYMGYINQYQKDISTDDIAYFLLRAICTEQGLRKIGDRW